jgi:hypothetical protein
MRKDSNFTGQPIFNQLLNLIPRSLIQVAVKEHASDRYCKRFKSYDHLVTMLYATFHKCNSLRELVTGMMACGNRLSHLGINSHPRRSTLSDANSRRTEQFFSQIYYMLYKRYFPSVLSDSLKRKSIDARLFIFDSTTIELFSEIFKGVGLKPVNGKRKGGIKAPVLMKADEDVPRFIYLNHARGNDMVLVPMLKLPAGSIVTFDRGYHSYKPFIEWNKNNVTWVTRLRHNQAYSVTATLEVKMDQKNKGIIEDQKIRLGSRDQKQKVEARKITYFDRESEKTLVFITNNTRMQASTITEIYKKRWQIECLFKRLKQNYPLKYFLGDSENAIKIQIWCALITDLLINIVKNGVKRK